MVCFNVAATVLAPLQQWGNRTRHRAGWRAEGEHDSTKCPQRYSLVSSVGIQEVKLALAASLQLVTYCMCSRFRPSWVKDSCSGTDKDNNKVTLIVCSGGLQAAKGFSTNVVDSTVSCKIVFVAVKKQLRNANENASYQKRNNLNPTQTLLAHTFQHSLSLPSTECTSHT